MAFQLILRTNSISLSSRFHLGSKDNPMAAANPHACTYEATIESKGINCMTFYTFSFIFIIQNIFFSSTVFFAKLFEQWFQFLLIFRGNDCTNNFSYSNIPVSRDLIGNRWRSRMECLIRKYRFNFEFNLLQVTSDDKLHHQMAVFRLHLYIISSAFRLGLTFSISFSRRFWLWFSAFLNDKECNST